MAMNMRGLVAYMVLRSSVQVREFGGERARDARRGLVVRRIMTISLNAAFSVSKA